MAAFSADSLKAATKRQIEFGVDYICTSTYSYSYRFNENGTGSFNVISLNEFNKPEELASLNMVWERDKIDSNKIFGFKFYDVDEYSNFIMLGMDKYLQKKINEGENAPFSIDLMENGTIKDERGFVYSVNALDSYRDEIKAQHPTDIGNNIVKATDSDVIVLRNGDKIKANILEISTDEIKYKKTSNPNGPLYTIAKNEVEYISYTNGESDVFLYVEPDDGSPRLREIIPAANNQDLIAQYNQMPTKKNKQAEHNKKYIRRGFVYWGFKKSSVLSTDEIEIIMINGNVDNFKRRTGRFFTEINDKRWSYVIRITNKTDHPIYIDLGNTYKVLNNTSYVWWDGTTVTETNNTSGEGNVFLGNVTNTLGIGGIIGKLAQGITLGGSKGKSVSIDQSQQRYLSIAPHSSVYLPPRKYVEGNRLVKVYEWLDVDTYKNRKKDYKLNKWELRKYNEKTAPWEMNFYITYSTDQNFKNYYVAPLYLYSIAIYGTNDGYLDANYEIENPNRVLQGQLEIR